MYELAAESALGELVRAHRELVAVHDQVVDAAALVPAHQASGWRGPAALVFQACLDGLAHDLAHASNQVQVAAELTTAAIAGLGGHV
jgi:hypothetical protein